MRLRAKQQPPVPRPTAERRLDALYRADSLLIESYRAQIRELQEETPRLLRTLIKGDLTILGMPVSVTWPEGRPWGMTDDELARVLGPEP